MPYYRYKPSEEELWIGLVWEIFIFPFRVIWWIVAGLFMLVMKLVRKSPEKKLKEPAKADTQGELIQAIRCPQCQTLNEATRTACCRCSSPLDN